MTPEELEAMKRQIDDVNSIMRDMHEDGAPMMGKLSINRREVSLVRAELVDALHDYAEIFREKARMENQRADSVEVVAAKVAAGGSAEQPDLAQSMAFEREQQLLHMRFQEMQMRVNRLIIEHGDN